MTCPNCGAYNRENTKYCTNCGAPLDRNLVTLLRGNKFLAICILLTIAGLVKFNILLVLFAIFCWILYSQASKNILKADHLRSISGTVYAGKIISIIVAAILAVVFVIMVVVVGIGAAGYYGSLQDVMYEFDAYIGLGAIASSAAVGIVLVLAIAVIVINILAYGNIHKFTKSLYMHVGNPVIPLEGLSQAKTWLLVLIVFQAIQVFMSFGSGEDQMQSVVSSGCHLAATILAYQLMGESEHIAI